MPRLHDQGSIYVSVQHKTTVKSFMYDHLLWTCSKRKWGLLLQIKCSAVILNERVPQSFTVTRKLGHIEGADLTIFLGKACFTTAGRTSSQHFLSVLLTDRNSAQHTATISNSQKKNNMEVLQSPQGENHQHTSSQMLHDCFHLSFTGIF